MQGTVGAPTAAGGADVVENEGIGHGKTPEKRVQEGSKLQQMAGLPSARRRTCAAIVGLVMKPTPKGDE
jgi:hypothetical protein